MKRDGRFDPRESSEPAINHAKVFQDLEKEEEAFRALRKTLSEVRQPLVEMMNGRLDLDPEEFKKRSLEVRELEYRIEKFPEIFKHRFSGNQLHLSYTASEISREAGQLRQVIGQLEDRLTAVRGELNECLSSLELLRKDGIESDWPIGGVGFVIPLAFILSDQTDQEVERAMNELTDEKREHLKDLIEVIKVLRKAKSS